MNGRLLVIALMILSLLPVLPVSAGAEEKGSSLYVEKVENLPEDFIFGMDISSVLAEEASGVKYYDFEGNETDLFRLLADNGINYIRVRVWNDPRDAEGRGFGGGNCDIGAAAEIGKRATACGMKLLVDFHYSDFWADPGKQMVPRAWAGMEIEEKTQAVYEYTLDCLKQLKDAGVDVGMVQTGNETNGAMCGEKIWMNIAWLMDAGARATREVYPDALVALHFANPENADSYRTYAKKMDYYEQNGLIHYDVFATSYYPYWHGTLDNLSAILTEIAETYGKKVMVMETSYAFTEEDSDFSGNTIGGGGGIVKDYPFTVQGQANSIRNITDTVVNRTPAGIGVVYWEGAWITVGTASREENQQKWEQYGSGWASSYAAVYDPNDAGKYYGGSAVDNQAFFDAGGHPLESLKVFRLMRNGNTPEVRADALEEPAILCDLNAPLSLPETVNAIMTDNSRQAVPVTWNLTEAQDREMHSSGPKKYEITGEAGGMEARCFVSMVEYNYMTDYSFEEGGKEWVVTDLKHADELYVEDKKTDSLTGSKHLHFWSAARDSVEFTAEQTVRDLPEGKFRFSAAIMGGDCGETEIYTYVKVDGQEVARSGQMPITGYNNWYTGTTPVFDHPAGSEVTVGIYVRCQGTGNGAWGKIDDALLNSVQ
ncbi:MAG: glycosyl hydrolase 53 family protein [Clostridia bacterium]|nr:glycosyl hydrolase 53 family protein [Clostridia bacterium]